MTVLTASRARLPESGVIFVIAFAGLVGAAIDAAYFSTGALLKGHSPVLVLQSIASFWLGPRSMDLGAGSALLGAATHVGLATLMAAGFALLNRARLLPASIVGGGAAYGILLYCTMYLIVMPLRWPTIYPRWDGWSSVRDIAVHVVIGLAFAAIFRTAPPRLARFREMQSARRGYNQRRG